MRTKDVITCARCGLPCDPSRAASYDGPVHPDKNGCIAALTDSCDRWKRLYLEMRQENMNLNDMLDEIVRSR